MNEEKLKEIAKTLLNKHAFSSVIATDAVRIVEDTFKQVYAMGHADGLKAQKEGPSDG